MSDNTFTRKDFLSYLAKGGDVKFNKMIKLNKTQLSKLDKDQLAGRSLIIIDGIVGFLDGLGYWVPKSQLRNRMRI